MPTTLAHTLAHIHAHFGLYESVLSRHWGYNQQIIPRVACKYNELAYLAPFYADYWDAYRTAVQHRPTPPAPRQDTAVSTNVDFPFLGETVVATGQAKFMFVLQGSYAAKELLSCPVLACLWPLDQGQLLQGQPLAWIFHKKAQTSCKSLIEWKV